MNDEELKKIVLEYAPMVNQYGPTRLGEVLMLMAKEVERRTTAGHAGMAFMLANAISGGRKLQDKE